MMQWWRNRLAWMFGGQSHNGLRNYDLEFGYPASVTPTDLYKMYRRNGIASRVIRAFPQATWEEQPVIHDEAGDSAEEQMPDGTKNKSFSPFVVSVNQFFEQTRALRYLERADRVSSIGRFGILLMGFKDGQRDLRVPLATGKKPLIYLAAYGEPSVEVVDYETDTSSERYGRPKTYRVTPGKYTEDANQPKPQQFMVHHSRVLHIAEFLDDGEVLGQPRLEPIYNHLLDLNKTVGSGAETFWRMSNPGISFTADADANIAPDQLIDMKKQAEEFENGMRRILAMQGVTPHTMGAGNQVADPGPHIDKLLDLIAGATGIPKRILIGSERGELASSQDSDNWASRIDERQNNFATPSILLPFVQKMVETGNIQSPSGTISVDWPESNALSPKDQAEVGRIKSTALKEYTSTPGAEMIVPPQEFRRDFLGLPPDSEYELPEEEELPEDEQTVDADGNPVEDVPDDEEKPSTFEIFGIGGGGGAGIVASRGYGAGRARRMIGNAKPRSLYIHRDLLNANEVRDHYKSQGIANMVAADQMHVTVCYSRTPVDWMKIGTWFTDDPEGKLIIPQGGARLHELFGKNREALVLLFSSSQLGWRHEDIKFAGASYDFTEYQPHVSLTFDLAEDLLERQDIMERLVPYTGSLIFGPEIFQEVKEDWKEKALVENAKA